MMKYTDKSVDSRDSCDRSHDSIVVVMLEIILMW